MKQAFAQTSPSADKRPLQLRKRLNGDLIIQDLSRFLLKLSAG